MKGIFYVVAQLRIALPGAQLPLRADFHIRLLIARLGGLATVSFIGLQSATTAQRVAQYVFDLRIQTAKFVVRPALHRVQYVARNPQRIGFALGHKSPVQRTGVDHRLRFAFAAEHHQQIAHHRRFALFVQVNDATL